MESEERRERLRCRNQCNRDHCAAENAQQREARLARWRVRDRAHRASRSAAQRERVLGYRRGQLGSETPDQRTSRLQQMSLAQQIRLTWDSGSERGPSRASEPHTTDETDPWDSRPERDLSRASGPCTTEETDPWDSRSERGPSRASESHTTDETDPWDSDQRETCLKQVGLAQQRRLTHETPEETATRCEQDRESHRIRRKQHSVLTKISILF